MGKKEDKLGIRASQTAELVLDDVRVPMENLLGGLDRLERKLERARSGERSRVGREQLAQLGNRSHRSHARASCWAQLARTAHELVEQVEQLRRRLLDSGPLGRDGGLVAAGDRAGERRLGAQLGDVLDRLAHQRSEQRARLLALEAGAAPRSSPPRPEA